MRWIPFGARQKQHNIYSQPFPQRLSAADTNQYVQPTPIHGEPFLTFWAGNQVPAPFIATQAHPQYLLISSQELREPVRSGGSFNVVLGQLSTGRLVARMRAAWNQRQ